MVMIRRINFLGGACTGKSTMAAGIFSKLRKNGYSAELTGEFVKDWAYTGRVATKFDSLTTFSNQLYREELPLKSGIDLVVNDSPILLSIIYAKNDSVGIEEAMLQILNKFENYYPSLNIFLERDGIDYEDEGRYSGLDFAKKIDGRILKALSSNGIKYKMMKSLDENEVYKYVVNELNKN
jgi:nicotinamide riboside kinase